MDASATSCVLSSKFFLLFFSEKKNVECLNVDLDLFLLLKII